MTPTVSVMMAAYNAERYVEEAVVSILGQTFADFELLILDDGSTDGTLGLLERLAASDGRIRVSSRPNAGIVATRNELFRMARGEFVAVLDSDDVAMPRRLELEVDYLRRNPDCLAVGGDVEVIDPDGATLCQLDDEAIARGDRRGALEGRRDGHLPLGVDDPPRGDGRNSGDTRPGPGTAAAPRTSTSGSAWPSGAGWRTCPRSCVRYGSTRPTSARPAWSARPRRARAAIEDARTRRGLGPAAVEVPEARVASPAEVHELGLVGAGRGQPGDRPQARDGLPGPDPVLPGLLEAPPVRDPRTMTSDDRAADAATARRRAPALGGVDQPGLAAERLRQRDHPLRRQHRRRDARGRAHGDGGGPARPGARSTASTSARPGPSSGPGAWRTGPSTS